MVTSDALTPIAAVMVIARPSMAKGSATAARSRSAMASAWWGSVSTQRIDELVAAEARAHVLRAEEGGEALRELLEELVADGVAVAGR